MTGSRIVDDATVLVQAGGIVVAASRTSAGIPDGAAVVDLVENVDVRRYARDEDFTERDALLGRLSGAWGERERFERVPAAVARFRQFIGRFRARGGRVLTSTNLPFGGLKLHRELAHLSDAGLDCLDVVAAVTNVAGAPFEVRRSGRWLPRRRPA